MIRKQTEDAPMSPHKKKKKSILDLRSCFAPRLGADIKVIDFPLISGNCDLRWNKNYEDR